MAASRRAFARAIKESSSSSSLILAAISLDGDTDLGVPLAARVEEGGVRGVESTTPGLREGTRLGMKSSPSESESFSPSQSFASSLEADAPSPLRSGEASRGLFFVRLSSTLSFADTAPLLPGFEVLAKVDLANEVSVAVVGLGALFGAGDDFARVELLAGEDGAALAATDRLDDGVVSPPPPVSSSSHFMSSGTLLAPTEPEEVGRAPEGLSRPKMSSSSWNLSQSSPLQQVRISSLYI